MEKLKEIEIVFENCDSAKIPADTILCINYTGLTTDFIYDQSNSIFINTVDTFTLHLKKTANIKYYELGLDDETYLFERLKRTGDIVGFNLIFEDGEQMICVPWIEEDSITNKLQKIEELPSGALKIIIERGE